MLCSSRAFGEGDGVPENSCSVAGFFDQVFVGSEDGRVARLSDGKPAVEIVLAGNKAVTQLLVLGEIGLLLALCGGVVEAIDTQAMSLKVSARMPVKGEVLVMAINQDDTPDFSVCLGTWNKINLFRWNGEKHALWKTINTVGVPLDLAWSKETICVAHEDQIVVVDVPTGVSKKVHQVAQSPSSSPRLSARNLPLSPVLANAWRKRAASPSSTLTSQSALNSEPSKVCALPGGRFIMCIKTLGIIINAQGEPSGTTVVWDTTPLAITCCLGFILTVHRESTELQVHSAPKELVVGEDGCLDRIQLRRPIAALFVPAPWNIIVSNPNNAALGDLGTGGGIMLLHESPSQVCRLTAITLYDSIAECFAEGDFSGASLLFQSKVLAMFDKASALERNTGAPNDALEQLARMRPSDEIPEPKTFSFFYAKSKEDAEWRFEADMGVAMVRLGLIEKAFQQWSKLDLEPRDVIAYFPSLWSSSDSEGNWEPETLKQASMFPAQANRLPEGSNPTESEASTLAALLPETLQLPGIPRRIDEAMLDFLWQAHERNSELGSHESMQATDTAILRLACALEKRKDVEELCRSSHALDICTTAPVLQQAGYYHAAALLFVKDPTSVSKGLDLWASLGAGELKEEGHDGLSETVDFLSTHHDDPSVVFNYSTWVLDKDPAQGLKIFTTSAPGNHALDPASVLQYLKVAPQAAKDLRLNYLEYLVQGTERSWDLELSFDYIDSIKASADKSAESLDSAQSTDELKQAFARFLDRPDTLMQQVDDRDSVHQTARERPTLEAELVARRIEQEGLGESLLAKQVVTLLAKCGRHRRALAILVDILGDTEAAEAYCVSAMNRSPDSNPFLDLLVIYFDSQNATKFRAASLGILERHGHLIDPSDVISKLPADLCVKDVAVYLATVATQSMHQLAQLRIEKNLRVAQNLKVRNKLMMKHGRNITVTGDTRCSLCGKPIGTNAFQLNPSKSSVSHMTCPTAIGNANGA